MSKSEHNRFFVSNGHIKKCMAEFRSQHKNLEWVKAMQDNKASVWSIHLKWLKSQGILYHKKSGKFYCKKECDYLMCVLKYE